jgi:DNA processing protein
VTNKEAYITLNLLPGIGPARVRALLECFPSPADILSARPAELTRAKGVGRELASTIANWREDIDLDAELEKIRDRELDVVTIDDELYPAPLRQIYAPPLLLYVWGTLLPSDAHAIAIVGSRRATHYGTEAARKFGFQLAHAGLCVVSGLARGIDTSAHEGALASGGRTVAVIGSGLGQVYPPENMALAERIADNGAVVSEFPIDFPPEKRSFPLRNRIVAGWCRGTLVVEAPGKSGALITAGQASESGRDVYAVPGPIDRPTSKGSNRLIQQGAKLVIDARDILDDLELLIPVSSESPDLAKTAVQAPSGLCDSEKILYQALGTEEWHIDSLANSLKMGISEVSATLLKLEMKRLVKPLPGKYFVKLV